MEITSSGNPGAQRVPPYTISHKRIERSYHELPWKAKLSFVCSILVGVGWLGPMIYLLWLNFSRYVVGARVPCLNGDCVVNNFSDPSAYSNLKQYDEDTKNTNGALQLVAKALEIYFVYVAGSLVWMVMKLMLKSKSGLPTGYLMRHIEFADLLTMREKTFWAPLLSQKGLVKKGKRDMKSIYLFAFLLAIPVAIIANLMGPAIAVLVLPTQQMIDSAQLPQQQFLRLLVGNAPAGIPGCSSTQISARQYSCATAAYGSVVDSLSENSYSALNQLLPYSKSSGTSLSSALWLTFERQLGFALNTTYNIQDLSKADATEFFENAVGWAPSRQVIRDLADDATGYMKATPPEFKNALQSNLERKGPILGFRSVLGLVQLSNTVIDGNREIRCYWAPSNDTIELSPDSAGVCFRTGSGWAGLTNSEANFRINDRGTSSTFPAVAADIYGVESSVSIEPFSPIIPPLPPPCSTAQHRTI